MTHALGVSEHIKERMRSLRGDVRIYKDLDPNKTALVIIDMQAAFLEEGGVIEVPAARGIVENVNRAAQGFRELGIPVIWIRSMHPRGAADWRHFFDHFVRPERREAAAAAMSEDAPPSHFYREMDVGDSDYIVIKNRYSCFIPGASSLERLLRSLGRDTVVLAGTKTDICVESTARDGMMLDFRVAVLSDGTATLSDEEHQAALNVLIQEFADVLTVDEVLDELRSNAGRTGAAGNSSPGVEQAARGGEPAAGATVSATWGGFVVERRPA
jgi:ureidoacrylate peracid hydrolase